MFRIFVPSVPVSNGLCIALIEPMDMRSIGQGVFRNALLICSRNSSCHVFHAASKSIWSRRVQASENLYTCMYLQIVCDLTVPCLYEILHLIFTEMLQSIWSRRVQAEILYTCMYFQNYLIVCDLRVHCLLETLYLSFTEMLQWSEFPQWWDCEK